MRIEKQSVTALLLSRGATMRVTDPCGKQVAEVCAVCAGNRSNTRIGRDWVEPAMPFRHGPTIVRDGRPYRTELEAGRTLSLVDAEMSNVGTLNLIGYRVTMSNHARVE